MHGTPVLCSHGHPYSICVQKYASMHDVGFQFQRQQWPPNYLDFISQHHPGKSPLPLTLGHTQLTPLPPLPEQGAVLAHTPLDTLHCHRQEDPSR